MNLFSGDRCTDLISGFVYACKVSESGVRGGVW